MDRFSKLHPTALLLFFAVSLVVTLSFFNPFIALVSLLGAVVYTLTTAVQHRLRLLLGTAAVVLLVALCNMLFAHYGTVVLFSVKNVSFTLNALVYGACQGCVLASSLLWFTALGKCLDSEKLLYLLRFAPKTALLLSMILGFIPRFIKKAGDIREARTALRGGESEQGLVNRFKESLNVYSALVTYSLESSIITADSMKARGYNPRAVRHGRFRMSGLDTVFSAATALIGVYLIWQKVIGNFSFAFDPAVISRRLSIPALVCFALLELTPSVINLEEAIRWKKLSRVKG